MKDSGERGGGLAVARRLSCSQLAEQILARDSARSDVTRLSPVLSALLILESTVVDRDGPLAAAANALECSSRTDDNEWRASRRERSLDDAAGARPSTTPARILGFFASPFIFLPLHRSSARQIFISLAEMSQEVFQKRMF